MDDDQEEGVSVAGGMLRYVRYVRSRFLPPNAPLELLPVVLRIQCVIHVAEIVLPEFSKNNNPRSVCFRCRWQQITGTLRAQPSCVRHPRLGTPISRARSSPTTTTITPTNTTISCNPNPNRGCWSQSRSRTSKWSKSGSRSGSSGASKSTWIQEKRKGNGGSSMSGHQRKRKYTKKNRCKPKVGPLCVPCSACPPNVISVMFPEASAAFSTSSAFQTGASGHASGSSCTVQHAFGVPCTEPRADSDRSITPVEQRRSPINLKVEQTEEESADENVMLELGVSSSFVAVHVPRVAFLCLRPCF